MATKLSKKYTRFFVIGRRSPSVERLNVIYLTTPYMCFLDREQPIDYGELEESIRKTCLKLGLEDVNGFVTKCIQLYETTVVRHGLMLVGPTGSGKTRVCW